MRRLPTDAEQGDGPCPLFLTRHVWLHELIRAIDELAYRLPVRGHGWTLYAWLEPRVDLGHLEADFLAARRRAARVGLEVVCFHVDPRVAREDRRGDPLDYLRKVLQVPTAKPKPKPRGRIVRRSSTGRYRDAT